MRFAIKALTGSGRIVSLLVDAASADAAVEQATRDQATVLSVRSQSRAVAWQQRRPPHFPLVLFSLELLALLDAGLGLVEALQALAEKEQRHEVRSTLESILSRLHEGQPLSLAIEKHPAVFPSLYIATVRASEKTGALGDALGRYVAYQTQLDAVRKKIVNASIYPVLLLVVGGLVVMFLMAYVVPRFASVYEGANRDLPLLSRLLLDWGTLLHAHGAAVLGVVAALAVAGLSCLSRQSVRKALLGKLWQVPALSDRMHVYQLARFYRTLGMLLKGGVPIVQSMEMVEGILQPALRARLQLALKDVREGASVSQAMDRAKLVTPVALRMLRVGERAGNMGEIMERIAGFHDEETSRWVEWATRLFEPILMAIIGLVIGVIVVLMYLPIFELAGSLQ
jgi:general secretion pathway protein F